jgi:hypothetical protein
MTKRARSKWAKSERRKLDSPFAPFPAGMIDSPAFHVLLASGSAFKLLLMLGAVWARNGGIKHNTNGQKLIVTYEQFCKYWSMDSHSVATALRVLVALGFLERVKGCAGNADEREPNTYRLTFLPAEGVPGTGTHEYRRIKTKDEAEAIVIAARQAREDSPKRVRVPFKNRIPGRARTRSHGASRTPKAGTRTLYRTLSPPCATHGTLYISPDRPVTDAAGVPATNRVEEPSPDDEIDGGEAISRSAAACSRSGLPRCWVCGADLLSRRSDARFCSPTCKKRARRRRVSQEEGR